MKNMRFPLISLLFLSSIASSCSSKMIGLDLTPPPTEEIIRRVEMNNNDLVTLRARGIISIESKEFVGTGTIAVSLKRPDSILLKIEGPFGIDIGRMLLTKDRFIYYDSYSNRVIIGATTNRNIRLLLRVDLGFADVMDFLSGTTSLGRQTVPPESISFDEDQLLLFFNHGSSTARYWVDPKKFVVVRYELSGNRKEPILETRYRRFTRFGKILLPRSISIQAHRQNQGLALHYDEIEINEPGLDFSLKLPEKAERIYW